MRFDKNQVDKGPKTNAQKLLRNELWRGQQRTGPASSPHSRQMASRCSVVPSGDWEGKAAPSTVTGKDIIMFVSASLVNRDFCKQYTYHTVL